MIGKIENSKRITKHLDIIILLLYVSIGVVDVIMTLNTQGVRAGCREQLVIMMQMTIIASYIYLLDTPIVSLALLLLNQGLNIVYSLLDKDISLTDAINDNLFSVLVIIWFILVHININIGKLDKNLGKRDKLIKALGMQRKVLKVKWWAKLVIYSTLVTIVMILSRGETLSTLSNDGLRVYGALALAMPTIVMLSILTTSEIAYEILGFKIILEIYTIYNLYIVDSINIKDIGYWLLEVVVFIWIMFKLKIANEKGTKDKEDIKNTKSISDIAKLVKNKQINLDEKQIKVEQR